MLSTMDSQKQKYLTLSFLRSGAYLSGAAGAFSDVAQRTVQSWTEKGLLVCPTAGSGDKRSYNVTGLIEIALIKSLTDGRVRLDEIKTLMEALRTQDAESGETHLEYWVRYHNPVYIIIGLDWKGKAAGGRRYILAQGQEDRAETEEQFDLRLARKARPVEEDKMLIVNFTAIAQRVLARL